MEFKYTAIDKNGQSVTDSITGSSYHDAVSQIHSKGLIPTDVSEQKADAFNSFLTKFSGVKLTDKILFIQNLSVMLKAGIGMSKALKIISNQSSNARFKQILEDVYQEVEAGRPFAEALAKYPQVFNNIFISMVRVGEVTGNLDKSLEYLGVQLQREHNLISKVRGAMIYPAVIVFAVVVVGFLLALFVLPSLLSTFKDSGVQLPLATRIIIAIVDTLQHHTLLVIGVIGGVVIAFVAAIRTETGSKIFDQILVRTPIFGTISKKVNIARFSRILSSMLKSGTPILEGLQVVADSLGNYEFKQAVIATVADVKVGKSVAQSLEKYPKLFFYLVTQMISVGEESGTVDAILEEIAARYEAEVDDTMSNLSSIIEPVLILGIGTAVGIMAIALIGPIYSITTNAGG